MSDDARSPLLTAAEHLDALSVLLLDMHELLLQAKASRANDKLQNLWERMAQRLKDVKTNIDAHRESFKFPTDWRGTAIDALVEQRDEEALQTVYDQLRPPELVSRTWEGWENPSIVRATRVVSKKWEATIAPLPTTRPAIDMRFDFSIPVGNAHPRDFDIKLEMVRALRLSIDELVKSSGAPPQPAAKPEQVPPLGFPPPDEE